MQRLILGIAGFGAIAGLLAMAAIDWATGPAAAHEPAVRLSVSLSVAL